MPMPTLVKHGHWFKNEWPTLAPQRATAKEFEQVPTIGDKWRLVDLFLEYKGLVNQHIDSYNYFVTKGIKEILHAGTNAIVRCDVDKNWQIQYEDIRIGRPCFDEDMVSKPTNPHMCRLRDITYEAPIVVDLVVWNGQQHVRKRDFEIGRLPVMLRSKLCKLHGLSESEMEREGECPYDPGGYFIMQGVERVLMMQEQALQNRIIVEYDSKKQIQAYVQSSTLTDKSRLAIGFLKGEGKGIFMKHSRFVEPIPVGIMLKAMGVQSDMEVIQMVGLEQKFIDALMPSLQEIHKEGIFSQKAALTHMNKYLADKFKQKDKTEGLDSLGVLRNQMLSHITCPGGNLAPKIRYVGLMIRRCISALYDDSLVDNRDYYGNKRVELSGQLISLLFEDQFLQMSSDLRKLANTLIGNHLQRKKRSDDYPDVLVAMDRTKLTKAIARAVRTGNWKVKRYRVDRSGVSQVLSRFSYMVSVGSVMRVKSQFEKSRKVAGPRALQPSQWGVICPADTPEGEQCGLVKHLSLLTQITGDMSVAALRQVCYCLGVEDVNALGGEEIHHKGNLLVFMNGEILGVHRRPRKFISSLRQLRRRGRIGEFVSIYEHEGWNAIFIASDQGRLCRPLIIVADGKPLFDPEKHVPLIRSGSMKFEDFLKQGVVEWVDVNEENNLLIALKPENIIPQTTHMEIEPFTLLGVMTGLVPYPHHNQSARNTFECAMGKQAMGCFAMNMFNRTDTVLYGLVYPQKPLCTSKTLNLVKFHHLGAGQNASVAVMSYSGYDIEDAIVMNRAALDRGFGRCYYMNRKVFNIKKHGENLVRDKCHPPPVPDVNARRGGISKSQQASFTAIGQDGICGVAEKMEDGFLIANKHVPKSFLPNGEILYERAPVVYKNPGQIASYVDRVILTEDGEGSITYKVMMRQTRRPELGDKFASRHGQKGVVGLIVGEEDLPFSESGWRPDLIMNPHGFPSRMTVGKMLECVASKAAVCDGVFGDSTAFGGTPTDGPDGIYRSLIRNGFLPNGKEYLTSGITGEALECYIFCGPIYYQKLKHMVADKVQARSTGKRHTLTRQPTEGRANEGGLRIGEMERDCLVAYGASNMLLERLMHSSDVCNPPICQNCGLLCGVQDWCNLCQSGDYVTSVRMPYACKLLFQELQSMNVTCRLSLGER